MLESLPISRKLAAAFGGIFLIAAVAMGFVFVMAHHVSSLSAQSEVYDREQSLAAEVETSLLRAVGHFRAFEARQEPAQAAAYQESMADFERHAKELAPLLTDKHDIELLASTRSAAASWRADVADPAIARANLGDEAVSTASAHLIEEIITGAEKLRSEKHQLVESALEEIKVAGKREDRVIVLGGVAMLAVALVMWMLLRRQIGRPVVEMTDVMRDLAHGNNAVEVPAIGRRDEIGAMADAVLIFRDNAIAKAQAEARKAIADAEQKMVVETLSDGLGKLSEGDLTTVIGDEFPTSYSEIRDNFNGALESLRSLVGSVMESTETIRNGSAEIADASEELAQRSQTNAASLEETTAAVTQINQRIGAAAQAATQTNARAGEAIQTVSRGRSVTDAAVQAMSRVSESAQGIDDVIEGLDKIAFQTRVLAMNAAVEAGRAGEAGRGFAVVADLVSALAMRAEEEAKRAREQLTATRSDISTAVDAVRDVDGALESIAGGVREVHDLVASMEVDNRAQSDAVNEITGAVTTMDHATQRNAAMVEETSAASRTLSHEVAALARQTARFRIDVVGAVAGRAKPAFAQTLH